MRKNYILYMVMVAFATVSARAQEISIANTTARKVTAFHPPAAYRHSDHRQLRGFRFPIRHAPFTGTSVRPHCGQKPLPNERTS